MIWELWDASGNSTLKVGPVLLYKLVYTLSLLKEVYLKQLEHCLVSLANLQWSPVFLNLKLGYTTTELRLEEH
jgi:hypothetical protein